MGNDTHVKVIAAALKIVGSPIRLAHKLDMNPGDLAYCAAGLRELRPRAFLKAIRMTRRERIFDSVSA
jgi:hypothetical protein